MNAAHIMNDEATRKYLQGMKRLLTFMQRAYPTDPSRSTDFDGFKDTGRGAAGGGSDKLVCLLALSIRVLCPDMLDSEVLNFLLKVACPLLEWRPACVSLFQIWS